MYWRGKIDLFAVLAVCVMALAGCEESSDPTGVGDTGDTDVSSDTSDATSDVADADVGDTDDTDVATETSDVTSDVADADATPGPPDTSAARFEETRCFEMSMSFAQPDVRCSGNVGCLELDVQCGECTCTLCADGYCLEEVCDDGGSPECPGSPWEPDAGDGG